jgi:methylthioribulose-1-phosphate dehydratase
MTEPTLLFRAGARQWAMPRSAGLDGVAAGLVELGRRAHARGWALGTSGNFSAVVTDDPLRLAVTASGVDKGGLDTRQILEVDGTGMPIDGGPSPSAETPIHLAVVRARGARAVAHTHSLWATLLSEAHADVGGLSIEGYEMLKGLAGVASHAHREWLPIVENAQDWGAEAPRLESMLAAQPAAHGFLIRRHGLYTWGRDLAEVGRHLEVLEFLLEAVGRTGAAAGFEAGTNGGSAPRRP